MENKISLKFIDLDLENSLEATIEDLKEALILIRLEQEALRAKNGSQFLGQER